MKKEDICLSFSRPRAIFARVVRIGWFLRGRIPKLLVGKVLPKTSKTEGIKNPMDFFMRNLRLFW